MCLSLFASLFHGAAPHFSFPEGTVATEENVLCWIRFASGIIWIDLLYFFDFVGFPTMKRVDRSARGKVLLAMMTREMWWFRWLAAATCALWPPAFLPHPIRRCKKRRQPGARIALIRLVAARVARGLCPDLPIPASAQGDP